MIPIPEDPIDKDKLIGRLRAEIAGLREEDRVKQVEIIKLRKENTELRFNWIAAAEGDILDQL
jgi:hypothetical protein